MDLGRLQRYPVERWSSVLVTMADKPARTVAHFFLLYICGRSFSLLPHRVWPSLGWARADSYHGRLRGIQLRVRQLRPVYRCPKARREHANSLAASPRWGEVCLPLALGISALWGGCRN